MMTDDELVRYAQGDFPAADMPSLVVELAERLERQIANRGYAQPDPSRFGQPHHGHGIDEDDD